MGKIDIYASSIPVDVKKGLWQIKVGFPCPEKNKPVTINYIMKGKPPITVPDDSGNTSITINEMDVEEIQVEECKQCPYLDREKTPPIFIFKSGRITVECTKVPDEGKRIK